MELYIYISRYGRKPWEAFLDYDWWKSSKFLIRTSNENLVGVTRGLGKPLLDTDRVLRNKTRKLRNRIVMRRATSWPPTKSRIDFENVIFVPKICVT